MIKGRDKAMNIPKIGGLVRVFPRLISCRSCHWFSFFFSTIAVNTELQSRLLELLKRSRVKAKRRINKTYIRK